MSDPIFDTNIVIDWLMDSQLATSELARYPRHRISRITWIELLAGEPPERRHHVQELIAPFAIVELDARIAAAAADIRQRMKMNLIDAMILASAQVNGAILVTRNIKDFPAAMPGIRVPYLTPEKA